MCEDNKKLIEDFIDFTKVDGMDSVELCEWLINKRSENIHKVYKSFNTRVVRNDFKDLILQFLGVREETTEETKIRVAKEKASQKAIEEAELKDYLRLKKKYGKKNEQ